MMRWPLAAIVVCLLGSSLSAQGTFDLKYEEADDAIRQVLGLASRAYAVVPQAPAEVKALPQDTPGKVFYAAAQLGGKTCWMAVAVDEPPRLWIDLNGNKDLSDDKPVAGKAEPNRLVFSGVDLPGADKAVARVRIEAFRPRADGPVSYVMMQPAGCRMGEVRLADRPYRVALLDSDLSGRYGDRLTGRFTATGGDGLAIDLNGDGQFAPPSATTDQWEWMPLAKGLKVGEVYYTVEVSADGSSVRVEKAVPRFGGLDLGPGTEVLGASDFGVLRVAPADGKTRVPAGRFTPILIQLSRTDAAGAKWTLRYSGGAEKLNEFEIRPDEVVQVRLGPPLVAKAEVQTSSSGDAGSQGRKTVSIDLSLIGQAGEAYAPGAMKGNTQPPPPSLEILDEAGKVLQSGKFEYG